MQVLRRGPRGLCARKIVIGGEMEDITYTGVYIAGLKISFLMSLVTLFLAVVGGLTNLRVPLELMVIFGILTAITLFTTGITIVAWIVVEA